MTKIDEFLTEDIKKVVIAGHTRPDGDCLGSVLGLYNYLKRNYPQLDIAAYLEPVMEKFHFISGLKEAVAEKAPMESDLMIILDSADKERIGAGKECFELAKKTLCIDHHVSNPCYCDYNEVYADDSSASETLCRFLDMNKVDFATAECLYTGIVHDTGVFKHSNTSRRTMELAGVLLEKGVSSTKIINETFYQKTFAQNKILGQALANSEFLEDYATVWSSVSLNEQEQFGVGGKELDGIIDQLKLTAGSQCAVFLYETAPGVWKASMRSEGLVNVSKIAAGFGGGGHVCAAGCTMELAPDVMMDKILTKIKEQLVGEAWTE